MPAKDIYHDTVKKALVKDGWKITAENLQLPWGGTETYVDIIADKIFVAEKEDRKIAVEVKSFVGKSTITEFEKALGQMIVYRFALAKKEPERELFLAVDLTVYNEFFVNPDVLELVESENLKILVFDRFKEVLVRWIN